MTLWGIAKFIVPDQSASEKTREKISEQDVEFMRAGYAQEPEAAQAKRGGVSSMFCWMDLCTTAPWSRHTAARQPNVGQADTLAYGL
jgi:hypothetical protein